MIYTYLNIHILLRIGIDIYIYICICKPSFSPSREAALFPLPGGLRPPDPPLGRTDGQFQMKFQTIRMSVFDFMWAIIVVVPKGTHAMLSGQATLPWPSPTTRDQGQDPESKIGFSG